MARIIPHMLMAILAAAALFSLPAYAGGGGGGGDKGGESTSNRIKAGFTLADIERREEEPVSEAGPRVVVLPTIAAPVFEDDHLHGYLFVSFQITVNEGEDPWKLRERVADVRDAVVRGAHRQSIGRPSEAGGALDEDAAREVLTVAISGFVSEDVVESIEVVNYDVKYDTR